MQIDGLVQTGFPVVQVAQIGEGGGQVAPDHDIARMRRRAAAGQVQGLAIALVGLVELPARAEVVAFLGEGEEASAILADGLRRRRRRLMRGGGHGWRSGRRAFGSGEGIEVVVILGGSRRRRRCGDDRREFGVRRGGRWPLGLEREQRRGGGRGRLRRAKLQHERSRRTWVRGPPRRRCGPRALADQGGQQDHGAGAGRQQGDDDTILAERAEVRLGQGAQRLRPPERIGLGKQQQAHGQAEQASPHVFFRGHPAAASKSRAKTPPPDQRPAAASAPSPASPAGSRHRCAKAGRSGPGAAGLGAPEAPVRRI